MKELRKWLFLITIVFMVALFSRSIMGNNALVKKQTKSLEKTLTKEIEFDKDGTEGKVEELINLDYDKMYVFGPYESVEEMEKQIGFKSSALKQGVSEGTNNILFIKKNKEVAYLFGYPSNSGYYIDIPTGEYTREQLDKMAYLVKESQVENFSGPEQKYNYYEFRN
jgi:hypothetical protein